MGRGDRAAGRPSARGRGHLAANRDGAYGPDAVLSHRSAAALWSIGPGFWKYEVTTPDAKRSRKGFRAHTSTLHAEDTTTHDRIPVTSVARTILDL
jgi:hypothetical protein